MSEPEPMLVALANIERTLSHMESDLISDRSKIDDITNRLSIIESNIKTLYARLPRLEDKQKDAIAEVVQPVIDSVDSLNKTIKKKTVITRVIPVNPFNVWLNRLKGVK